MKRRIHCDVIVANSANAITVRNALADSLLSKDVFAIDAAVTSSQHKNGSWHVQAEIRFNSPLDADAWYAEIAALVLALAGSRRIKHDCEHNDPPETWISCVASRAGLLQEVKA